MLAADPTQMRQLLQNLVGNALKFRREGVPPSISVRGRVDAKTQRCVVEVEDNGIGFEAKYAERIFQVFQRLHGRDRYEGTGIGLAICRKIVERHNGSITVRSTPGVGSTFLVSLPLNQHTPR
jgi:signal transduction histidine kinase